MIHHPPSWIRHPRGISLIETVLSLLILGGAFVALLNTVSVSRTSHAITADRQHARLLAEDLMGEVLGQAQYTEPGLFGLEVDEVLNSSRANFDDIDDYAGWSASPPVDAAGNAIQGAEALTRSVAVVWVDPDNPDTQVGSDQGLVRIVVTVRRGDKELASVQSYRSDIWHAPEESY